MKKPYSCQRHLIGLLGNPVWENPTEAMMEAAFKHHQLPFRYISTQVSPENLEHAFLGFKALGYKGFNCTLPYKQAIIPYLDSLSPSAKLMGAVNCVVERHGKYVGENTDGEGFIESLKECCDIKGQRILILGAGGAARAIAIELALAGAESISLYNRTLSKAEAICDIVNRNSNTRANAHQLDHVIHIHKDINIVINATNIGLYPDHSNPPISIDTLERHMIVSDVIPNPPLTPFLKAAQTKGCTILDGLGMLVNQGFLGIKHWSSFNVDKAIMRNALNKIF